MSASATGADDPVSLLQNLIRRPSVTPTAAGVLDVVAAALEPLGFTVTRLKFEGDGSYPVDNIFATRGSGGKHLLFGGHTDVVPPGDGWAHDPFAAVIADGRIYGRGAADMKSGVAAFIAGIARAGEVTGRISLAITNDEEQDSINGTEKLLAWTAQQGHRFDYAIVGEPSATAAVGDSIKVGRLGSFSGRITVTGVQGHVAYPDRAKNPIPVLAAAVTALKAQPLDTGHPPFPASNLEFTTIDVGNETSNVIPARVMGRFNIRYNSLWTPAKLETWVRERLASVDAMGCAIDFEVAGRPSEAFLSPSGGGTDVLSEVIARRRGAPPEMSTAGGTSDARFIARYCPVVECGLPGPTMHKVDENVLVADVEALTQLYADFIRAYFA
jgi:succinyl-diaminopimelate desuccinylase